MTDRELLDLAAKAYGWRELYEDRDMGGNLIMYMVLNEQLQSYRWNPLTDHGDALRLAVKLGINLTFDGGITAQSGDISFGYPTTSNLPESTRRAIVRVAAEIGRSMK